ncbi:MAG: HAMP domain-containing sensor histidine kinase [Candidatus Pacebacteria bacterium]|nr:HAMP domain-containing sensor histidine kinase [Candidatus Paceibacterota bacterium]
MNAIILLAVTIFSYLIIKGVYKEVANREKIEHLAEELEKTNESLQELDQQKSEFVSLASHQLRGPLSAVKGYASLILEGDFGSINDQVKDAVQKMFESTQGLVVLVNDYLNVSRIEQGRMEYDFSLFDLKELVCTVVSELRPTIETAKLTLDFDVDSHQDVAGVISTTSVSPTATFMVNADKVKIKQVISNIIDNAVKYTPKGGIHVWIKRVESSMMADKVSAKPKILITISDTGVGILPEVLPRLFEKFTRAPDANKTNIMGTGLGLFVAKKFIEALLNCLLVNSKYRYQPLIF